MIKKLIVLALFLSNFQLFASDILILKNGKAFEGKVLKIKNTEILFQAGEDAFYIPASDIGALQMPEISKKLQKRYARLNFEDNCLKGRNDAQMYHGKAGLHITLGVLFGPFAIIGAAISGPKPQHGKNTMLMSQNKELFSDAEYLQCYKKKARGQNVGNTAIGWGAWILFLLII
jgi:hypothetical protein